MKTQRADTIKAGDVIMPPERELRLWMRRHIARNNLPETALHQHVLEVALGSLDKGGRWLIIKVMKDAAWGNPYPWRFKARPATPWKVVEVAQ